MVIYSGGAGPWFSNQSPAYHMVINAKEEDMGQKKGP
jgi:hypothetical protein